MPRSRRRLLELYFFDAGGGHRSAATALLHVISQSNPDWEVTLINLQELLQGVDPIYKVSKFQSQDIYNGMLKRGLTHASFAMLRGLQQGIKLIGPLIEERLRQHWRSVQADLVVSLIPNFNGVMFRALREVHPSTPYITVMTDLADCPPHFWQEPQDQYLVCGTDRAVQQAVGVGYPSDRIFRVSGMILKPQFYASVEPAPKLTRESIGLDPSCPTALVMFGGYGASTAAEIVKAMRSARSSIQTIVLCGHNEKLRRKLQRYDSCHAVGFTTDVPSYMRLADFFIGKPGPGSISEALHMGLPVILERNRKTMPQERYNTFWIEMNKVGLVVKSFGKEIAAAVDKMMADGSFEQFRLNAGQLKNEALFEIPRIFERLIEKQKFPKPLSPRARHARTPQSRTEPSPDLQDGAGPSRIQLSRKKGWCKPAGAIKVDRTTPWGNPYRGARTPEGRQRTVQAFREMLEKKPNLVADIRRQLHGKDLACWCHLDQPCHADVLLEVANVHLTDNNLFDSKGVDETLSYRRPARISG